MCHGSQDSEDLSPLLCVTRVSQAANETKRTVRVQQNMRINGEVFRIGQRFPERKCGPGSVSFVANELQRDRQLRSGA